MAGEEPHSAAVILSMIHDFPGHSRLVCKRRLQQDKGEKPDLPEELQEEMDEAFRLAEARRWANQDQELLALQVNALHRLIEVIPHWPKGKKPDLGTVGPDSWRSDEENAKLRAKQRELTRPKTPQKQDASALMDQAMSVFGFNSGG